MMTARYLTIDAKHRQFGGVPASIKDFSFSDGETVNADIMLTDPTLSLYCMDDANQRAIFVQLPAGTDLTSAPFIYTVQYESAERLVAIPYDRFDALAHTLPEVKDLIMVYMTGRSGSTLLSHVFNQVDGVVSLSEPDVGTQFAQLRQHDGSRDPELRSLFDSTVRVLFSNTGKPAATFALKLRSEALLLMDMVQALYPQAKNLFLYRDAVGWVASFYRVLRTEVDFTSLPVGDFVAMFSAMFNYDFSNAADYLDPEAKEASLVEMLTLWWLTIMDWYLVQSARGIPILPVRYADLNANSEAVVKAIFTYCDLPVAAVDSAMHVFEQDSQAGTGLARENSTEGNRFRLTDAETAEVERILARHPVIKVSDFIVPQTLQV